MKIRDSVAFVTGANRGIGLAFAQELLAVDAESRTAVIEREGNPGFESLEG